jgi:manganese transport protein
VIFTSKREIMGGLVNHRATTIVATIVAALISGLNVFLLYQTFS